jgi:hypothetical protein
MGAARGRRANTGGKRESAGRKRGVPNKLTDKAVREGRAKPSERLWLLGDVAVNEIVKYKKAIEKGAADKATRAEYKWWMEYARKAFCDAAPFWSPKLAAMAVRAELSVEDKRKELADPRQALLDMFLQMQERNELFDKAEREKQTPKPNSPNGDGELDQGDEVDQND